MAENKTQLYAAPVLKPSKKESLSDPLEDPFLLRERDSRSQSPTPAPDRGFQEPTPLESPPFHTLSEPSVKSNLVSPLFYTLP